jgi:hypothetical protein
VDYLAREEREQAVIEIQSWANEYTLDWDTGMTSREEVKLERSANGRLLTVKLDSPRAGEEHKFRFRKLVSPSSPAATAK